MASLSGSSSKKKAAARSEALRKDIDFTEQTWEPAKLYAHFFNLDLNKGLTTDQVMQQRAKHGTNSLTPPKQTPAWLKFLMQFTNFFALLLLFGGTLCFIGYALDQSDPTNLYLGIVLYVVVIITATFSHMQESKSEKIMEGFKSMIPKKCNCLRDGQIVVVDAWELVPGDVVDLQDGSQVPADIRVMTANECKVDNSSLTGESEPVDRTPNLARDMAGNLVTQPMEAENLVFYTTMITTGSLRGVVIGTGDRTAMGQIAGLTTETVNDASPIAQEIEKFVHLISGVAIVLGISFFFVGVGMGTYIIKNVVFVIGIIVANVPEGLLATVTVSLALTAQRMAKKEVLVKNLEAVETLGSTTVICSDKTGTLTQNRMTVQHCWYDFKTFRTPAAKNSINLKELMEEKTLEPNYNREDPTFQKLFMVASLCNNAKFLTVGVDGEIFCNMQTDTHKADFNLLNVDCTGDASESGIVKFAQPLEDQETFRARYPKVFEIKFNSTNKWQLSIHEQPDSDKHVVVLKGAPERVLLRCDYMMKDGEKIPKTPELEDEYTRAYEGIGSLGERVLGFAYSELDPVKFPKGFAFSQKPEPNFPTGDLVFAGLLSLIDPPRPGVPEAVAKCKRARVKVFMVTGDHPITAKAIAKQIGIIDQDKIDQGKAIVIKGDDIRDWLTVEDKTKQTALWDAALDHEQIVWARVSPNQKLLIVENNQRRGEVVAVTGDGVNDAPALKKGNIGIAMGIAGKDVSKEAADMILMDDNFASIVNGVEEGRLIFDNLKKSICYTLTSNIPEIGPFLLYITLQLPAPLSTVLILCVDLGTDMVPAISMAYEEKESDIMMRPPRNAATDRLVNSKLIVFAYLQIGMMQALAGFFTYMVVLNDYGYPPWILPWKGLHWDDYSILCTWDGQGKPSKCGYGCKDPEWKNDEPEFCDGGCKIPFKDTADPFVEFTETGFRGFKGGDEWSGDEVQMTCQRSCSWWASIPAGADKEKYLISPQEDAQFAIYCADYKADAEAVDYGFTGRDRITSVAPAPTGSFYWWDGRPQWYPNVGFQKAALAYAQTSYFISIIVVQWADLLIAKTRKLSLFEQGMQNGFMNFGLCFETALGCVLLYIPPLNQVFGTRPLAPLHWFPGVPWSMLIFLYDETRKYLMRQEKDGWIERYTYW
mmetsp:Transcript_17079/g.20561  ORF Transcript_17079/g.20561 Transcript_17079/m.20561 type:complete len:1160 (+) Transcript_17079:196-3675(+)|eukprot:CAMPEP_0197846628 /NCGR_PEP_ID=MMETSP1438-20131217/3872_1 /TAXON_ID=1461541 /ORGANISM="Pterosperma sp., Strain CCMP1384" /LENGTH=1159 /DNA_ID=CAMNT_0043458347 /DNA_START=192 /DNA_END=3671 /DNA_ORIENTATION=+